MTPIPPLHQLEFPEAEHIGSAAFAPDGSVLYVHLHQNVVNVWPIVVHYWPEIVIGVLAVAAFVLAVVVLRVLRWPRRVGERYCRRCNYHLAGLPGGFGDGGGRCPECGVEFRRRRPVVGRGRVRRVAPGLAGLEAVIGLGVTIWAVDLPRSGNASRWLTWQSRWLYDVGTQAEWKWLDRFRDKRDLVLAVDPGSGSVLRTVATQPYSTWFDLLLTPDGESLFLAASPTRLVRVSTATGRVLGALDVSELVRSKTALWYQWDRLAGFTQDGSTLCASHLDGAAGKVRVFAWHLTSGECRQLGELDAINEGDSMAVIFTGPRLQLVSDDGPAFLTFGGLFEKYPPRLHDGRGNSRPIEFEGMTWDIYEVVTSADRKTLFFPTAWPLAAPLVEVDVGSGEVTGEMELPDGVIGSLVAGRGEWLTGITRDGVALWKYFEPSEVVSLSLPPGLHSGEVRLSSDAAWLATIGYSTAPQGARSLLIYNVAPVTGRTDAAPSAPLATEGAGVPRP